MNVAQGGVERFQAEDIGAQDRRIAVAVDHEARALGAQPAGLGGRAESDQAGDKGQGRDQGARRRLRHARSPQPGAKRIEELCNFK